MTDAVDFLIILVLLGMVVRSEAQATPAHDALETSGMEKGKFLQRTHPVGETK